MLHFTCTSFNSWARDWPSTSTHLLSELELSRLAKMRNSKRKSQFLAGRLLARTLISEQFGYSPYEVELAAEGPTVARCRESPLIYLSISHTADFLAVAVGEVPVGIDCEQSHPPRDWLAIAQSYFSADEVTWLRGLPEPLLAIEFMRIWTAKEALAKCSGEELGELLASTPIVDGVAHWPEPFAGYRCWGGEPKQGTYLCLVGKPTTSFTPASLSGSYREGFDSMATQEIQLNALVNTNEH